MARWHDSRSGVRCRRLLSARATLLGVHRQHPTGRQHLLLPATPEILMLSALDDSFGLKQTGHGRRASEQQQHEMA
jgi:hypothetical protein